MVKKTQKKATKNRKISKKAQAEQAEKKKLIALFVSLFLLLFAATQLGVIGVTLYNLIRIMIGSLAYLLIIGIVFCIIRSFFKNKEQSQQGRLILGLTLIGISVLLSFQAYFDKVIGTQQTWHVVSSQLVKLKVTEFAGSGMIGHFIYSPLKLLFSVIGVYIIAALLLLIGLYVLTPKLWHTFFANLKTRLSQWQANHQVKKADKQKLRDAKQAQIDLPADSSLPVAPLDVPQPYDFITKSEPEIVMPDYDLETGEILTPEIVEDDASEIPPINFQPNQEMSHYQLPEVSLLAPTPIKNQVNERSNVQNNIKILETTFKSFGIQATVESAVVGPSVSKYEIKLATGVKVSRILNLQDDLALALAAKDVRIEAPIPGKSLVGIEIPNAEVAMVGFREMWESAQTSPENLLEVPLGKAVDGSIKTFNLAKMPHILVAGSTGSGKSVAVNGIIASILMKALPSQVKFLMIDPKMVELDVYNDIPHLLIPVVTNPRKAARALQKIVDEMESRYELFRRVGSRNIEGYNAKVDAFNAESQEKQQTLPLIVVIVDELADLMMVASKEVEDAIIRIGQKARAAGIHMILATQRPSVDVISGLIKANVPSRVAFAVSSGTDSRTILDSNGAEKLLGRGDMLFKPIDENHALRLQGAFLSDEDVASVVSFIKDQASADYDDTFDPGEVAEDDARSFDGNSAAAVTDSGDPLFEEAKQLVVEYQKASASMLQRRLSTGFNRATRIMEELEAAGIIGPAEGTKPRKVLLTHLDDAANETARESGELDDSI
ncbi:MAG: DNA translocase FtsK 4TM domain-containing protein [Lactococcus sp.]|jgi:S-DNA-T family DNA segregation ATPase FtsK/SpoIIIE|nr:DNA translocase FtsK [Lactococcus sp.]MDN5409256.1 DNA translocase FtsK 4TM domain-containing protein [Lactococcus sp.]MDN5411333.1 DNA translocase FtsK 4TM domain-containing protein [Lactococcus sp.]MDN5436395.1 DNA translocase FtsK 4TM domain-containing protein [Lactococcus sp.]MDN5461155.1 DNA translocase FtsK 4TM domain-containing protein [Lactococcus sp.]MDN5466643.1 DNA translocase FtsK 4TM domain-containing protein [Lactococcus sp.]